VNILFLSLCMHARLIAVVGFTLLAFPAAAVGQRMRGPVDALMDAVIDVRISGLRPGQRVLVRASMPDSTERVWRAEAEFVANRRGEVSTTRDSAVAGSYVGIQPMGLATSMDLPEQPGAATYTSPSLDGVPMTFVLVTNGRPVDSLTVVRRFRAPGVRAVAVREPGGPAGTMFSPARSGRSPAILVLGGSEGGNSAIDVAALLASRGYVALSLAYFGADSLPREIDEIPLEYFTNAMSYLGAQPQVDSTRIALFGTSKGAEAALLVGTQDPRVRAVVAYAPSSVVWSCICANATRSSWSIAGVGVPSVPPGRDPSVVVSAGQPQRPAAHYRYRMQQRAAVEAATIPVERIGGPVMLIAGEADELWPSGEMARQIQVRLAASPRRTGDATFVYPGAGHRIGKAYLPAGSTRVASGRLETGGTPAANAAAQADAWPRALDFLARAIRR
jgi:dienelactone hydrolase